jgi:hypothetical protein
MIGCCILRSDQNEEQVGRSAVQRSKINSLQTAGENSYDAVDSSKLSMRDRHAFTNGRCADPLPFQQNLKNLFLIQHWMVSSQPDRHFFQDGVFFASREGGDNRVHSQKICNLHSFALLRLSLVFSFCFCTWR